MREDKETFFNVGGHIKQASEIVSDRWALLRLCFSCVVSSIDLLSYICSANCEGRKKGPNILSIVYNWKFLTHSLQRNQGNLKKRRRLKHGRPHFSERNSGGNDDTLHFKHSFFCVLLFIIFLRMVKQNASNVRIRSLKSRGLADARKVVHSVWLIKEVLWCAVIFLNTLELHV